MPCLLGPGTCTCCRRALCRPRQTRRRQPRRRPRRRRRKQGRRRKGTATKDGDPSPSPRPSRLLPSILPADTLSLARCDLEAADATTLQLVEGHGGGSGEQSARGMLPAAAAAALGLVLGSRPGRCVRLRAPGAEESCEWAIVIRESISLLKQ